MVNFGVFVVKSYGNYENISGFYPKTASVGKVQRAAGFNDDQFAEFVGMLFAVIVILGIFEHRQRQNFIPEEILYL